MLVILVILAAVGMEKTYDFFLKHNCDLKSSYTMNTKINAEMLILGPCEPMVTIKPEKLQELIKLKTYNLATNHSCFAENYLHLYLYLKNNTPPKYLLLYVTTESTDGEFNVFNTYRFPHFLDDSVVNKTVKDADYKYYRLSFIPFMKYAYYNSYIDFEVVQGIKHYLANKTIPNNKDGFREPWNTDWDYRFERKFTVRYPKGKVFEWNDKEVEYLKKTIELAQKNNIKVVLYESPFLGEVVPYILNRKEILDKTHDLAKEYNVQYCVFDTMQMCKSRKYFVSMLITNKKGSELFTQTLADYFNHYIKENEPTGKEKD